MGVWVAGLIMATPLGAQTVPTLASNGKASVVDGSAADASFLLPLGIASDALGNVYVSDAAHQRVA